MKKWLIIGLLLVIGVVCFAGGFLCSNFLVKKNQSIGEAKKAEYEDTFQSIDEAKKAKYEDTFLNVSKEIITNSYLALEIIDGISSVWKNVLEERGLFKPDAPILRMYFKSKVREYLENEKISLTTLEETNVKIITGMQTLRNYPTQYQEAYNTLMELYVLYNQLYSLAQSPPDSLISFPDEVNKINDLQSEFTKVLSKLKIYMPRAGGKK